MRIKKRMFYAGILILIIVMIFCLSQFTQAASNWTISPTPATADTDTEFCIGSSSPGGGVPADYVMELEFAADFDLSDLTISDTEANSEVVFYTGTSTCSGGTARIAEATETADNDRDYAAVSGQKVALTLEDSVPGSTDWSIKFRSQAGESVVTPLAEDEYLLIATIYNDTGDPLIIDADLIYVGGANQVNISADVDPSLTLTLSGTTCSFGTFSTSTIKTCNYYSEVDTNASGGYTAYVKEDGDLRNATNSIDNVADNEVTATYEEYGIATSDADYASLDINQQVTDCASLDGGSAAAAVALTTSDQSYATASGPVDNNQVTLCVSAAIAGSTPAGAYSNIVTVTAIGNF